MGGAFCGHGKVRTLCADCKPAPLPPKSLPPPAPTGRAPGPSPEVSRSEDAPSALERRGPGKPLMPQRRIKRKASAEDVENAEAWWVRKR